MVLFFILSGYSPVQLRHTRGIFNSHPQVTKFWGGGDTPKKGTTLKLKISEVTDFVKEIVCIGVIDPVESKSGLFILARPIPSIILTFFVQNLTNSSKTRRQPMIFRVTDALI